MKRKQRVVLIEDEYLARDELKDVLRRRHKDIEVVAEAETAEDGWRLIERGAIDGVFLDITLETENHRAGMDLAHGINTLAAPPWIVFTTAHPEFAMEAHDVHPAHYLLKPLDDAKVAKALEEVRRHHPATPEGLPPIIEITHRIGGNRAGESRQALAYVDPRKELLYVCTTPDGSVLRMHLQGCRNLSGVTGPLRDWEDRLVPYGFDIIHRSYLVNRNFRDALQPHRIRDDARELTLKGGCPDRLPVSRNYRRE